MAGIGPRWAEFLTRQTQDFYVAPRDERTGPPDALAARELPPRWVNKEDSNQCPPFGCAAIDGGASSPDDPLPWGYQPSSDHAGGKYMLDDDAAVDASATGACQLGGRLALALYDDTAGTPAAGDTWGPEEGQWSLTPGAAASGWGFFIVGVYDSDRHLALGLVVEQPAQQEQLFALGGPLVGGQFAGAGWGDFQIGGNPGTGFACQCAWPQIFDPTANDGYGGYTDDTSSGPQLVVDFSGHLTSGAEEGAWAYCQSVQTEQGSVNSIKVIDC
jgi:hypothetical protein